MADIELVIKINESKLWLLKNEPIKENFNIYELASYIDKGVLLPKGHGDLKDESDLDLFAPNLGTDEYVDDLMAKHNIDYVNGDDEAICAVAQYLLFQDKSFIFHHKNKLYAMRIEEIGGEKE